MVNTLSESEIISVLDRIQFGHLGCTQQGIPYVYPMAFVYHAGCIYGQTTTGQKTGIVEENPQVCFQVQEFWAHGWSSVLLWGTFQELDFNKLEGIEANKLVELLTNKLASIQDMVGLRVEYEVDGNTIKPITNNGQEAVLFRIKISEMTGRSHNKKA